MFAKGCSLGINSEKLYTHVDTGANVSLDFNRMYKSSENIIQMCKRSRIISEQSIAIYNRRLKFTKELRTKSLMKKIFACITNIDICMYKIYAYYR